MNLDFEIVCNLWLNYMETWLTVRSTAILDIVIAEGPSAHRNLQKKIGNASPMHDVCIKARETRSWQQEEYKEEKSKSKRKVAWKKGRNALTYFEAFGAEKI